MEISPDEIAALLKREGSGLSPDADFSEPQESTQPRVDLLADVLAACHEALLTNHGTLEVIAEKLGDGSRDVAWRRPYGQSGILDFFLQVLGTPEATHKLKVHSLRIVGNSSADTDENRARVIEGDGLATIMNQLQDESLLLYTIPVLYNTLVDYEPAQLGASQSGLNLKLINLLASANVHNFEHLVPYFCKILALLITQDGEPAIADPLTPQVLLQRAIQPPSKDEHDVDDFTSLVSVAAAYLASEAFQADLTAGPGMMSFVDAFKYAHTWYDAEAAADPDTDASLKQLQKSLFSLLADLTASDKFAALHSIQDPVPQALVSWLRGKSTQLRAAACLALGNLARSDEQSLALVQEQGLHEPLTDIVSDPSVTDPQLLHGALSFLKNLAIPEQNKPQLGSLLQPLAVPRILGIDALPQVQFAAVSLTRLLLLNCPQNVRLACRASEADFQGSINIILSLFDRSDAEPTKLEAARSIAAVCRILHSHPVRPILGAQDQSENDNAVMDTHGNPQTGETDSLKNDENSKLREAFYQKYDFSKALSFLVTQQKWPILRSQTWFVFALMSRSEDGASVVINMLSIPEVSNVLAQAITGETTPRTGNEQKQMEAAVSSTGVEGLGLEPQQVDPKQQANMAKVDRENCLVLCTEIVKNWSSSVTPAQLTQIEALIRQGTELLVAEKN